MPDTTSFSDLLACPRCDKAPLALSADGYGCRGCKTGFTSIGDIPWLFADPDSSLGEWRNRLHFELQRLSHEIRSCEVALRAKDPSPLARRRLERQAAATDEHRKALQALLSPLDVQAQEAPRESHLALRTRLPLDQALDTYYANVHRDWAWGDEENRAALAQVRRALEASGGTDDPGAVLVLGSGASRLAYDLHMEFPAANTVALDFNPLLLLIAKKVTSGESLELHEFPIAPVSLDDFAVRRTLTAPAPVREGFHFLLADVLRPPFKPGAFDLVVTPWLIDIVTEDLGVFAARINRLLKRGGRWVNFGSLAFTSPDRARRYSAEEALAIAESAGFDAPASHDETIPYMCSPASRHGRRERVFTFSAVKSADGKPVPRHKALPDWLVVGNEPVPLLPSFRTQAASTRIYSFIMSLIDGRRSITDMAKVLEERQLMTRREALPAIRGFLIRMYDDAQRKSEF
jgi:ubiquinone/menaquinone biosynthesis C-methylase UbiE